MGSDSYNGWTNYETWIAYTWLSDTESDERFMRELAADGDENEAAGRIKEALAEQADNEVGNGTMWADLMRAALSEIDYLELAQAFRES